MALTATAMTSTALRPLPAELVNFSGSGLNGAVGMVFIAALLIGPIMGSGNSANNLQNALGSGAVALVPVAIGVAVLRYRLYDIDRIISRTVAYAIVTGLLVGVYGGSVLLATQVLHFRTPVAVAAATLVAAALFTPVRRRARAGPRIGMDQPSSGPVLTRQLLARQVRVSG
jgi:hypothetical protein